MKITPLRVATLSIGTFLLIIVALVAWTPVVGRLQNWMTDLPGKACVVGGQQIKSGSMITLFKDRVVESGRSCDAIAQKRTCTDGTLTGDDVYSVDTCSTLEHFTGINLNRHPEKLDLPLMNEAGATWMRASADVIKYFNASTTKQLTNDWKLYKDAHNSGKKSIVSIWWDFSDQGEFLPEPHSPREQQLFNYLDTTLLPALLPFADIIVSGNEPFVNSTTSDIKFDPVKGYSPVAQFYERATEHINDYMIKNGVRDKHKLYMGAFTRLYVLDLFNTPQGYAIDHMLKFAANTPYVDGVDIHTHVTEKGLIQIADSLDIVTSYTKKPILDTEYSYIHKQAGHINKKLNRSDAHNLTSGTRTGLTFLQKYTQYSPTTTGTFYMAKAGGSGSTTAPHPVSKQEWDDFFRSRTWTIDHFILGADAIFKSPKYNFQGANYPLSSQNGPGGRFHTDKDSLPWYLTGLYVTTTVKFVNGKPPANYQDLEDFQKINGVTSM